MLARLFLHGCLAAAICALPVAAQDSVDAGQTSVADGQATRLALAQEIMDIGFPEDTRVEMFQKVSDQMEAQMLQSLRGIITDEAAMTILTDWQERVSVEAETIMKDRIPGLMDAWAIAYADIYDERELRDIRDFVGTPSGQAFMVRSNDVLSHPAFAAANQEYIDETTTLVMGKVPELMEELMAYKEAAEESAE